MVVEWKAEEGQKKVCEYSSQCVVIRYNSIVVKILV